MTATERQQRTMSAALTILAGIVIVGSVAALLWAMVYFLRSFSHVFLPPAIAGILALVFQPYYELLRFRLRLPRPLAILALLLSIAIPILLFVGFFGNLAVKELMGLISQIPSWWEGILAQIEEHGPGVRTFLAENPLGQKISQMLKDLGPMITSGLEFFATSSVEAGVNIASWAGSLLSWAVAPVYFVFFLTMKRQGSTKLEGYLPFLRPETRKDVVFLGNEFVKIVVAFFRGQIIIAFLQGVLLAIGFSVAGLQYGLVLGLLLGFLNIIPYLGSSIGLAITLPLAYFQLDGGVGTLASVLVVISIVQMIEGYLLTPKIMGNRTGLHPMVIILAVFFWGSALGGVLGMILAIPLTAFLVVFWRLAKEKYIAEIV